jgi:hypothetical protein
MIALLTYPTPTESAVFEKRTENDSFSYRVWELHRIIADPASQTGDVKNAKLSLLRTLRKSRIFERTIPQPFQRNIEKESSNAERSRSVASIAASKLEEAI